MPQTYSLSVGKWGFRVTKVVERRRFRRNRALKDGKIVFNAGMSVINCTIRDRTESGAKLQLAISTELPKVFELHCLSDGSSYPAEIVWRRGLHVGITFIGLAKRLPRRVMLKQLPVESCG